MRQSRFRGCLGRRGRAPCDARPSSEPGRAAFTASGSSESCWLLAGRCRVAAWGAVGVYETALSFVCSACVRRRDRDDRGVVGGQLRRHSTRRAPCRIFALGPGEVASAVVADVVVATRSRARQHRWGTGGLPALLSSLRCHGLLVQTLLCAVPVCSTNQSRAATTAS